MGGDDDNDDDDGATERICNLDWNSDFDRHFGPSWELYPNSDDEYDDDHHGSGKAAGPCPDCNADISDGEPHFRIQLLGGSLALPSRCSPTMDPLIWSRLPSSILERTLAMVPVAFTFRLALVCKNWLSLFSSPGFKLLRFEVARSGFGAGRLELPSHFINNGKTKGKVEGSVRKPHCSARKQREVGFCARQAGRGSSKACLGVEKYSGITESDEEESCPTPEILRCVKRRPPRKSIRISKRAGNQIKACSKDGTLNVGKASSSSAELSDVDAGHSGRVVGNGARDEENFAKQEALFNAGMSDAVCALEYQPGSLCPGCQPRPSDIAYFDENKVYRVGLSFLPEKFRLSLPPDYVVKDGFVCLFKAESFTGPSDSNGVSVKMKRLNFCVVNPITRSWKELPSEVCTQVEFKKWREDWTVCLEVEYDKFTVCLLTPREKDGQERMTVNTYSHTMGTWKLTFLQNMRYITPAYALEGEGKWPCYTICKGFLCTGNYRRAHLETMIHNIETGELVYFQDDSGLSSEDDLGDNPPLRVQESCGLLLSYEPGMSLPFRVASNQKGFYCAARYFTAKQTGSALSIQHLERAVEVFLKERRWAGYAIWNLDVGTGVWSKISKSPMPPRIRRKLMKCPPWSPFRVYRGRGPKEVRILYVDEAAVAGDTIYLKLGVKEDYNFLVSDPDMRLWTGMVAYQISDDSWKLIYHGLIPRLHGNEWHILRPNFVDFCLC